MQREDFTDGMLKINAKSLKGCVIALNSEAGDSDTELSEAQENS